jgi:hypothetical protein
VIRHGTFAETKGNGRDALKAAVRGTKIKPLESTQSRYSAGIDLSGAHDPKSVRTI